VFGESSSMEVTVTAKTPPSSAFAAALDVTYASAFSLFGSGNTRTGLGVPERITPHRLASQRIVNLATKGERWVETLFSFQV
jgi:hypothetical protein